MNSIFDKIIVALDVSSTVAAKEIVVDLYPHINFYKVGMELFLAAPEIVSFLIDTGCKVFLDLKLDDIPETITRTVRVIAHKYKVDFISINGNADTALAAVLGKDINVLPKVFLLTHLSSRVPPTSFESKEEFQGYIAHRAKLAQMTGCDGIICAPEHVSLIRNLFPNLLMITPGIRLSSENKDDHRNPSSPGKALSDGADYIVMGRTITRAKDRRKILTDISEDVYKHKQ